MECDDDSPVSAEALVRSPSLPAHPAHPAPAGPWTLVYKLQNELKTLKLDVKKLQQQLNEEKQERAAAVAAIHATLLKDAKETKC
ncbi:unnamed protein product [Plutella xylostella]|uniref:(diamondback moth) hypothetical protein n=1 Tax=Plutella xylostella TaxID=51655 RepID=A0A8S4DF64_PLUXY|nr:unnamed protein product [Plutella xylostella]